MNKKISLSLLSFFILITIYYFNDIQIYLNIKTADIPSDRLSISDQLVTIDTLSSPKIILSFSAQQPKKALEFINVLQTAISKNEVKISDVFMTIYDVEEMTKNEITSFLEKNNIFLQTILDSKNEIKHELSLSNQVTISVVSIKKLVWKTTNLSELQKQNLSVLIKTKKSF